MNSLVGEALETAQLCVARLDLKPDGIQEIINAAGKHCNKLIGRHPISVRLSSGLKPVRADLSRVTKALVHLLENAIKYSPPEKPITITADLNGDFVVTSVADCGCGIDESEQDLIFKRFYRGKDHSYAIQGTGMGLPIANEIIRAHGGSLAVTSQPGQGSIFSFSLPIY